MKKIFLTLVILLQLNGVFAQNYKKVEPYLETITKYEVFAAKAVDDYSISIYQDSRKEGVRQTLLGKLKGDRAILVNQKISVNNDTTYTMALVDFIDSIIVYFESSVGEFNIENEAKYSNYEQLEARFKLYNFHADIIEKKFIDLIKLKESFSMKHGLPIKIEYGRDVYKNQFFRYTGRLIEIISKIDFADIKLQQAIATKNQKEMNLHYNKLQEYLLTGKLNIEKLGSFKENDRMYLNVTHYISSFMKFQVHYKNVMNLNQKFEEMKSYAAKNGKDEFYNTEVKKYNSDRKLVIDNDILTVSEKNMLIITFTEELNKFQKEHLENLLYNSVKIKNQIVSMRKN